MDNACHLLDGIAFQVVEQDGGALFRWQGTQGGIEFLIFKPGIGARLGSQYIRFVNVAEVALRLQTVQESVVGNAVEPSSEFLLFAVLVAW